ncbi:MAG: hypothetical protein ACE5HE_01135 [Phycisphaerae bacterium]
MARFVRWSVAAFAVLVLMDSGCAPQATVMLDYPHASRATLTQSPHEHYRRVSNIAVHDRQALIEDLDILFLTDRPGRLTRWHDQ